MIKRDARNIGWWVRVIPHGTVADNRVGKVVGFRGDHSPGVPFVSVLLKNLRNDKFSGSVSFPSSVLEKIEEPRLKP